MLNETLIEVERLQCHGESVNEDCLLTCFRNPIRSRVNRIADVDMEAQCASAV